MNKSALVFVLSFLIFQETMAQKTPVIIKLVETNQKPVIAATVKITNWNDSTQALYASTDTLGLARFELFSQTQYLLSVTSVGLKSLKKGIKIALKPETLRFVMDIDTKTLDAVTVTAKKPLMSQEDDMTIIDPEPIANMSTSAYEIMEKTPGLFLDQDGNVYLSSTTPATIYINGREQKMSTADIATMLKSLPPNSIAKIEIMRTPSAKYDASGSGGVVNIVLKKGVKIGRTGSINTGFNQGRYGNQFLGININNNDGAKTSFLNVNYTHRNSFDILESNRRLSADTVLTQNATTTFPGNILYVGYGLGRDVKQWEFHFDGRVSYNNNRSAAENSSQIKRLSTALLLTDNLNILQNNVGAFSVTNGLTAKYKIDSLGSDIFTDISYSFNKNNNDQLYQTNYLTPSRLGIVGDGNIGNNRHLFVAQTDLKFKLKHNIIIEAGAKASWQVFSNSTQYFLTINEKRSADKSRTNAFDYHENINAVYLQGSKSYKGLTLKVGTRLENTNMNGHQLVPNDTTFKINRSDFFPYIYFSRKLVKIAGYELRAYLVYRRSITRPVYEYLNPSPRFVDQYLYEIGNPMLRPQFTTNYEVNISVQQRPIFAFGRNYTQDIFTNVIYQDPKNRSLAYRTYDNLGNNQETYFRMIGAIPPGGRYFFVVGTQYGFNEYQGRYEGKPLAFSRSNWSFFTYHQLKIDKRSTMTLNGFYRPRGAMQFYEMERMGSLNMSLNRQFLNRKLMITLSANDILYTSNTRFSLNQGTVSAQGMRRSDSRRFGVNIRYDFGGKKRDDNPNMFNFDIEKTGN
jgi:iron complex outermembrane recepter protein